MVVGKELVCFGVAVHSMQDIFETEKAFGGQVLGSCECLEFRSRFEIDRGECMYKIGSVSVIAVVAEEAGMITYGISDDFRNSVRVLSCSVVLGVTRSI